MSAIKIKRVLQQVIGGTNQPIKLGGILEDGSDSVLTIENGEVSGVTKVFTATIPSASWTGSSAPFSKAITISGILSTDEPIIDLVLSGTYATDVTMRENWSKIYRGVTNANSITFYADSVPSADISIQLVVVR